MKRYLYNYKWLLQLGAEVTHHHFKLRCTPCVNSFQWLEQQHLLLHPTLSVSHDTDVWGNLVLYGYEASPHRSFAYISSGVVGQHPYLLPDVAPSSLYRVATTLTHSTPEMVETLAPSPRGASPLERALWLSQAVYDYMSYTPSSTTITTTAAQAFESARGVCQDYAHLLLALCRRQQIAARYVVGMVQGTGETHAWVEVYSGEAWHAVDPTHNRMVEYGYIKIAHGRDADDAPVNRGTFCGTALQQTQIEITVNEL